MESLEQIKERIDKVIPGAIIQIVPNPIPPNSSSLLVSPDHCLAVARFLREDPQLQLDYASNVTGIDWPDRRIEEKIQVKRLYKGEEIEVEESVEKIIPGYLEVVYHLFSMARKQGPVVVRMRTGNRSDQVHLPSLTPVYRGAEFQEREVYDLYGIIFDGHPDLRRLLMWDEFEDFPMRKDYVEPDDYEYEPTPHGEILNKTQVHYPPEVKHG